MSRAKDNANFSSLVSTSPGAIVTSDEDSLEVLEAGTDGYVLTADSGEPNGIKWAAPGSSGLSAGQITDLTDAGDSALHYHATDRALGNATGTLAIANGGTGATTAQAAINAISAVSAASEGQVLTKSGSNASWVSPAGAGLGNVSTTGSAVANNLVAYSDTSGDVIKDSGVALSGVVSTTGTQTITNKTMGSGNAWNGTAIGTTYGGTAQTSWTKGDVLYASATNTLSKLNIGTVGQTLKVSSGGIPAWETGAGYDSWGDTTWVNTFHNTNRTVTSDVVADAQIISVAEVGKHGIVAASKSSGNAATGAQSTIGVASFVNNDNTANPQSAYGAYIETVRKAGASTTHGIEVGLTNYGTTVDSSPYNTSPTGLTEVARLAVNTGINAGTKVSHALSIVSVNESPSYANKFSKGIVFHNMALDGTNGNDGNKATALALARGHSLDWFVYTGAGSGALGPRLTSNVSVAADAMQVVFENKEVSFNNNVGTQSVAIKNNGILNLKNNTGIVPWTENGDVFVTDNKLYVVLDSVATEVSGGGSSVSAGNLLSVKDYGAVGDGITNDTTAIQNCINACFSGGKNMLVPAGTYLVTALTMSSDAYANHFSVFGEGRNKTIIRKYATSSTALLTIGDTTPAIFQANITMEGITFDGLNTTTAAAVRTYDMVRSSFKDCTFMRANVGFAFNGGVANQFYNCMFDACNYGVFMQWVSGISSQPNETLFNGCQFVNNPLWGLYFTHGALCVLDSCEVEGNGTSGNTSTGGIYVGSLETLAPALVNSQGIIAQNCWFEANSGRASCSFADGRNTIRDSYFIANPNSTYEIYVSGGTYVVENCSFQNAKTHHLYETAAVSTGNYINAITGSATFTKYIDTAKTKIDYTGPSLLASPYFVDQPAVGSNITYYSGQDASGTYSHNAYQSVMRVTRAATDYTGTPTAYTHCGQLDCMAVAYNASAGYQQYFTTDGGGRTMSAAYKARVDHNAKGDINGFFATISVNGHTNMASVGTNWTGGPSGTVCGGEVYANAAKVNIYGQEFQLYDNGQANVTTLGAVYGLYRTNATATLNNACTGVRVQSGGTVYADVGFQVSGNVKFGLDLTGMLYDANKAGIIMPVGSRIYMGAAATAWPTIVPTASGAYLETDNTRIKSSVGLAGTGFLEVIAPTTTSTASAGSASALPAVPFTYLTIKLDGVNYKIPVYNN